MGKDQENLLAKYLYQASDGTESISVLSFPRELHHRVNTTCIAALRHLAGQRLSSKAIRLFHPHMKQNPRQTRRVGELILPFG